MNTYSLRDKKFEYQNRLNDILKKYYLKFFKKTYNNLEPKSIKDFQKKILQISNWSDDKIDSQYNKFLKFINSKYQLSEEDVYRMLDVVFILNIKIIASLFGDIEINVPEPKVFWYKCFKYTSKYVYENPKKIKHSLDIDINNEMHEIINNVVQKYIPLKDIIDSKKSKLDYQDFNNCKNINDVDNVDNVDNVDDNRFQNLKISKENDSHSNYSVPYLSSEEFKKEHIPDIKDAIENDSDVTDEKYIKLPKNILKNKNGYDQYKSIRTSKNNVNVNDNDNNISKEYDNFFNV